MTATLTASGRDLRTLVGIVSEDRGEPPAYGLAPSLLSDLLGLIRCDCLSFVGMDTAQQADWFMRRAPLEPGDDCEETEEDSAPFWQHYWDSPCCSYPDRPRVDRRSRPAAQRADRSVLFFRESARISPSGTARCLPCCVPPAPGLPRRGAPPPGTPTARSPADSV